LKKKLIHTHHYIQVINKNIKVLDSKLSQVEAEILINRMILEHKFDETTKKDLLALINCFMPKE
jgi:hypothetical protein